MLICSGKEGTFFWDIIKYKMVFHLKKASCVSWNSLIRFDNLIISGGVDGDIKVYNMNFECIQTIEKAHNDSINGLTVLNNGSIASFSLDSEIKIWDF